jgi:hypothetical protein
MPAKLVKIQKKGSQSSGQPETDTSTQLQPISTLSEIKQQVQIILNRKPGDQQRAAL